MIKKTFEIPIYCAKVTVILDKDLSYVEKKYKTISLSNYGAVTLKDEKEYRHYVVAFTDKNHLSNIAHEIVHLKNNVFCDCSAELSFRYDEHEAYLTGWLFDKIQSILNKN